MMDMFSEQDKLKCFHTLEVLSNKNYKIIFPVVIAVEEVEKVSLK